ncbi:hypothetical protein K469DRAFT_720507 [Zopfia rhizophila CBS 207.26]|uniref:Ubiquinol-cytochrome c chaperone domain-containing protein n=1 Tax=Zopfia rhizophila CBS 207.26 TaxID=1314779 RepID=A0A6A6EKC4_9PEZI|nr:hypothetical protein K469DRAFT_720507 [Zopfia rhizophila CBS 207.26]
MASNYTCRACSKALMNFIHPVTSTRRLAQKSSLRKPFQSLRSVSTSAPTLYHATPSVSVSVQEKSKIAFTPPNKSAFVGIAQELRKRAPLMTETYVAYGATKGMFLECARHGDYKIPQAQEKGAEIPTDENGAHVGVGSGWWYDMLGLTPTFNVWAQITFIHMYMLQVRFRMFPSTHAPVWTQHLINHAFYAAEDRLVVWHKITSSSLRQKYLKDLFSQWRGVLLSYDEGLVKGDAMLAAALWRNLLNAREDIDYQKLAEIVGYIRREIRRLDEATDDEVARGSWRFGEDPGAEAPSVMLQSKLMKEGERA